MGAAHTFDERLTAFTSWATHDRDTGWTSARGRVRLERATKSPLRAELSDSQRTMREAMTAVVEAQRNEFDIFSPLPSNLWHRRWSASGSASAFSA